MERLPEDMAVERYHHDIVKLLREHHPRSPQLQPMPHPPPNLSQHHGALSAQHPAVAAQVVHHRSNTAPRSKPKRPKSQVMGPPHSNDLNATEGNATLKRSSSVKKKRDPPPPPPPSVQQPNSLDGHRMIFKTEGPLNTDFSGPISMPQFAELGLEQPNPAFLGMKPVTSAAGIQQQQQQRAQLDSNDPFNFVQLLNSGGTSTSMPPQPVVHQRQQSMPATFPAVTSQSLTPQQQQLHRNHVSPPPPRGSHSAHTSPQSIQLYSMHIQNPPNPSSPNKLRPPLPTSPTHLAALRLATATSGFDFPSTSTAQNIHQDDRLHQTMQRHNAPQQQPQQQQLQPQQQQQLQQQQLQPQQQQQQQQQIVYPHYPTPPSHHSGIEGTPQHPPNPASHDSFPTPSPESPGQWSNSPHSQGDWSESVRSPPGSHIVMSSQQQVQHQPHHLYQVNSLLHSRQTIGLPPQPSAPPPSSSHQPTQNSIYI